MNSLTKDELTQALLHIQQAEIVLYRAFYRYRASTQLTGWQLGEKINTLSKLRSDLTKGFRI